MTEPKVSPEGLRILRHALGLTRSAVSYRNRYVAGPGHDSMPDLEVLESQGFVARLQTPTPSWYAGDDICFRVTPAGIEAVSHD